MNKKTLTWVDADSLEDPSIKVYFNKTAKNILQNNELILTLIIKTIYLSTSTFVYLSIAAL